MPDDKPKTQESSGPPNLQGDFFNRARRSGEKVTIFLMNGKKLSGRIRAFDRYTILLDSGGSEEVIFKHAVSTVSQSTGTRASRSKPRKRGKRPEASGDSGGRPRPSEQPLSHRMDLSSLQGQGESSDAPAATPGPDKEKKEAPAAVAPPATDPSPAVETGTASEAPSPAAEEPAADA